MRGHANVTRIGERREPPDLQVLPGRAGIGAAEQPHAHRDEHRVGARGADTQCVRIEHAFILGIALQPAAQVRVVLREIHQRFGAIGPGFPAVEAAHRPAHFERRVDMIGVRRVGRQTHHAAGERHLHALRRRYRQFAPGGAAVIAAQHTHWRCTRVHPLRLGRMDQHRPDLFAGGSRQSVPVITGVVAAIDPVGRTDEDDSRFVRVNGDRLHRQRVGQARGDTRPPTVVVVTAEQTAERATGPASRADVGVHRCTAVA